MTNIQKVLVAIDGSPDMEESLSQASRLAGPVDAEILLLRVITPPANSLPQAEMRKEAHESLHHASRHLTGRIRERVWEAEDFSRGIIDVIEAEQPDLVILTRPEANGGGSADHQSDVHKDILEASRVPVMLVPSTPVEIATRYGSSAATGPGTGEGMGTQAGSGHEPRDIPR